MLPEFDRLAFQSRLRQVRLVLFGANGVAALAKQLDLDAATWAAYERGEPIPGPVLQRFISLTGVDPDWLLTGDE